MSEHEWDLVAKKMKEWQTCKHLCARICSWPFCVFLCLKLLAELECNFNAMAGDDDGHRIE